MRFPIYLLYLLTSLLTVLSCAGETDRASGETETAGPQPDTAVDADQLIMQLSAYLIAEPQTQGEREQNAIVNHAIDQLIPLERTRTGLFYRILDPGSGDQLQWGDYISAHYRGSFLDGKLFDDSRRRGKALQFYIGNMISGWNEGLQLIAPGGRIQLFVPSPLGYGTAGLPNGDKGFLVPPNTPLVFEVEVLERLRSAGEPAQ